MVGGLGQKGAGLGALALCVVLMGAACGGAGLAQTADLRGAGNDISNAPALPPDGPPLSDQASPLAKAVPSFQAAPIETCLADAEGMAEQDGIDRFDLMTERLACVGRGASVCADACQSGDCDDDTLAFCYGEETLYWDDLLNRHFQSLIERAQDRDRQSAGTTADEAALRARQRAWIAYRDAACDEERGRVSRFDDPVYGQGAGARMYKECLMQMTAQAAIWLWRRQE